MYKYIAPIFLSMMMSACANLEDTSDKTFEQPIQDETSEEVGTSVNPQTPVSGASFSGKTCSKNIWNPELVQGKQFVALSFDGSYSLDVWQETLDFAKKNDVKFTFYIVANHFLTDENRFVYDSPRHPKGRSDVGFGGSRDEVKQRLDMINRAFSEGHSIASHANGHWDGGDWTKEEWIDELQQFRQIMGDAYDINDLSEFEPKNWDVVVKSIKGFRAPLLAHNDDMYSALSSLGYTHDSSFPGFFGRNPELKENGVWGFPLVSIPTETGPTLSMDYNFLVKDKTLTNQQAEEKMYTAYISYYNSSRILPNKPPMQIGHHFSRWKEGAYWNALQRFVKDVCNKDEVICGTSDNLAALLHKKHENSCS